LFYTSFDIFACRFFKVGKRMDAFYKMLVKDSLDREDVEDMEKEKLKSSYEILQMFRDSNGIYHSFISESVIQLVLGCLINFLFTYVSTNRDQHECYEP
jgi:hypothetical protein